MTRRAIVAARAALPTAPPALWRALSRLHGRAFAGRERRWSAQELASLAGAPGVLAHCAVREGAPPLGFVMARVAGDDAEVLTLAVASHARRRGLASLLLDAAERAASEAGAARMILEVAESAAPARALYARRGYCEIGRRRGYYAAPLREDALVLALVFKGDVSA